VTPVLPLMIAWVAAVARVGSTVPFGELRLAHLGTLAGALGVALLGRHLRRRSVTALAAIVAVGVLVAPALALRGAPDLRATVVPGVELWRSGGATVLAVDRGARPEDLLEGLRRAGVRRIDLLVAARGGAADAEVAAAVAHRWPPGRIWAPEGHRVPGATVPARSGRLRLGGLVVTVDAVRPNLVAVVSRA